MCLISIVNSDRYYYIHPTVHDRVRIFLGSTPITWKTKQVALSSTEAEYMPLGREALYLKALYNEFGRQLKTAHIYSDNSGSLLLIKNPIHHGQTKHIDVRHHFCRELQ